MEIHYFGLHKVRPPRKRIKKKNHFNKINKIQKENQVLMKGDWALKFIKPGIEKHFEGIGESENATMLDKVLIIVNHIPLRKVKDWPKYREWRHQIPTP